MAKIEFAIVGSSWRAEFFLRIARACPDQFEVVGITSRNPEKRERLKQVWQVEAFPHVADLLQHTQPQFVVTCIPREVNVFIIKELAQRGVPVFSETPPAPTIEGLIELFELTQQGAKIQVAEQYHLQPRHAARLQVVQQGLLGPISQTQISVAHDYHGISLMRKILGVGFQPPKIQGTAFTSSLIQGPSREGPPTERKIVEAEQQFFHFDYGDKLGLYDFSYVQYFSEIRNERLLIRGENGEMVNDTITYLKDYLTPIQLSLVRHVAGANGNLEGNFLKGLQLGDHWVYRNPFIPVPLTDDEIAIASCLVGMADYVKGGEAFYSLAEAAQDQYLSLLCEQALGEGKTIQAEVMPWGE